MAGELVPAFERSDPSTLPVPGGGAPAGHPQAPPLDDDQGIQWGRYIAALQRYRWLILGVTILDERIHAEAILGVTFVTIGAVLASRRGRPS